MNKTRPGAKLQIEETYNNLILINIKVQHQTGHENVISDKISKFLQGD